MTQRDNVTDMLRMAEQKVRKNRVLDDVVESLNQHWNCLPADS